MCSTDDTHLKLECFLFGEREKATVAGLVRLFSERERTTVTAFVRLSSDRSEDSVPAPSVTNNLRSKNLYGNSSAKSI